MTLIDKDFLKEVAPDAVMKKMASLVSVGGVGPGKHSLVDYATIDLYFSGNNQRIAGINQEVHVVDRHKIKMLIGINTLGKESFTINIKNRRATIGSCKNIVIPLEVAAHAQMQFTQQILADKNMTIPARTLGQILVRSKLPEGRNLFFEPSYAKPNVTVFAQIVNCGMTKILTQNNTDNVLIIAGKTRLGRVVKYKVDACYRMHIDTVGTAPINPQCLTIRNRIACSSNINPSTVNKIAQIVEEVEPSLWKDIKTTVNLPEKPKDHEIVNRI